MNTKLGALVGALAVTLAIVTGSGAFTTITAERSATVQVAGDADSLLRMEPADGPNGQYVDTEGGTVSIDVSNPEFGAEGVPANAVTRIDRMLRISNHGTQSVALWITENASSVFFYTTDGDPTHGSLDGRENAIELGVGESITVGVVVDSGDADPGTTLLESVVVHASTEVEPSTNETPPSEFEATSGTLPPGTFDDIRIEDLTFCIRNPVVCFGPSLQRFPVGSQILIGDSLAGTGPQDEGRAYAITSPSTSSGTTTSLSNADVTFDGPGIAEAGESVAVVGDVNGDGESDYLIGAPSLDDPRRSGVQRTGGAFLVLGPLSGNQGITSLASAADVTYIGEGYRDRAGEAVAHAGDVNGDGLDDFLIGAPGNDSAVIDAGAAYLILGSSNLGQGTTNRVDLANADVKFIGEIELGEETGAGTTELAGSSVAGAGDVNGDGLDDILIGAPDDDPQVLRGGAGNADRIDDAGSAFLVYGQSSFPSEIDLVNADAQLSGNGTGNRTGSAVAGAGDVNDDGFDDILVGAPPTRDAGGTAYLVYGEPNLGDRRLNNTRFPGANATFFGRASQVRLVGDALAGPGDVNGDGVDDLLIGAPGKPPGTSPSDGAYLVYGSSSSPPSGVVDLTRNADVTFTESVADSGAGRMVSDTGDVNGDGNADVLIGAPNHPGGGEAYVVFGGPSLSDMSLSGADITYEAESEGVSTGESGDGSE